MDPDIFGPLAYSVFVTRVSSVRIVSLFKNLRGQLLNVGLNVGFVNPNIAANRVTDRRKFSSVTVISQYEALPYS